MERGVSKKQDRTIYQRDDGTWANKRNDGSKPSSVHDTQQDAIDAARENLKNQGGGELIIQGINGKIRDKITIKPGNDPYPPQG